MSGLVVESREGRRLIGRLAAGELLIDSLLAVCQQQQVRSATISATGVLESVSLAHYDRATRAMGKPRTYRTSMQLISATGALSERDGSQDLQLNLVLSRAGDNGIEVIAGVVTAATVVSCEYVIDAMDDVLLRRRIDRASGLVVWQELLAKQAPPGAASSETTPAPANPAPTASPAPQSEPAKPPPAAAGWQRQEAKLVPTSSKNWGSAAAASAAAQAEPEPEDDGEYRPIKSGDIIDHPKFGRCAVERVDANEEFATVRLRNARLVRLNIDVLELAFTGEDQGKQVFAPRK